MTLRLYHTDSYLREFEAEVLAVRPHGDALSAVLDRTAFYPTSGGQPHDLGALNDVAVVDVIEDGGEILHVVAAPIAGRVRGRIDWVRRFDHMQQHTGQHILSQAALLAAGAQTRAVHFGAEVCTLDLEMADLAAAKAEEIEALANTVVVEDRPVSVREVDEAGLADLGLRRPAKKRGRIRVVEVEGFDRSACGGTHVRRSGEIGLIKIRRWERYKGGVRLEFLCGWRALRDYRWKSALVTDLAMTFSVKDREVGEAVARLAGQVRERDRALAQLREQLLEAEARDLLRQAAGRPKVVAGVLAARPADEVAALAGKIVALEPAVAVFGSAEGKVVIARSQNVDVDVAAVLRGVIAPLGGRGGGRPEFAQGAVPETRLAEAVEAARVAIAATLGSGAAHA